MDVNFFNHIESYGLVRRQDYEILNINYLKDNIIKKYIY